MNSTDFKKIIINSYDEISKDKIKIAVVSQNFADEGKTYYIKKEAVTVDELSNSVFLEGEEFSVENVSSYWVDKPFVYSIPEGKNIFVRINKDTKVSLDSFWGVSVSDKEFCFSYE